MLTTLELIEMIREKNDNCTDYRLAKLLNVSPQSIHKYTKLGRKMHDETALKAADLLDLPPFYILACIQAENATSERICQTWEAMASQFLPANFPGLTIQHKMAV